MCFIRIDEINQFHWILSTGETLFSWSIQLSNSFAIKQACLKVKKSCRLFFRDMQNYISFKNQLLENGASLLIIPNPSNGSFSIEWPASSKPTVLEINNSIGQLVSKKVIP